MASIAAPVANIYSVLTGQAYNHLLEMLKNDSLLNRNLRDDFNPQKDDYDVLTFFEVKKTKVKKKVAYVGSIHVSLVSLYLNIGDER